MGSQDELFALRNQLEETYNDLRDLPEGPAKNRKFEAFRQVQQQARPLLEAAGLDPFPAQQKLDLVTWKRQQRASDQ